ncbi:MAG TPA: succinate dehydrogenase flavoprotein subunit [Gemmatimonadota bacterium]|nr:succinate dehydrogenase flavoprotein subunit [Gemmatimonadota bacterium]
MARVHTYDALVVGAGGAGLMASLYLGRHPDVRTAVVSKLYPTRSHTGAAQGGIGASLGNMDPGGDRPEWHTYDTVKGSDYLGDQDAIEVMCQDAPEVVYELEHMGLPFSRTEDGRIAQRRFGGHTKDFGEEAVRRSCYAASRTGHAILQTLYQQCVRHDVKFFNEFHVVDLLIEDDTCRGVVALELATGELHVFRAKAVLLATGGHGRVWEITSNAVTLTGDGLALVARKGLPLEDLEFYQFHPTGIYRMGILITEGVRGEGGILRNSEGDRFMEEYAPNMKDLASRDVVSRAIYKEIRAGRGIDGKRYVHLDATHLGREVIEKKLTEIADFCRTYLGIDPVDEPMPVQPTAHYAMGGIPTNIRGEVMADETGRVVRGLYAAGEAACVSVHGANRLGTNSLLDLVVFGRRSGDAMAGYCANADLLPGGEEDAEPAREELEAIRTREEGERAADIRTEMQELMMHNVSVFRTGELLEEAQETMADLFERSRHIVVDDKGSEFNLDLTEAWETKGMVELAQVITECALNRTESRGAHSREDFPKRNDEEWLKHTFAYRRDGRIDIAYKPVTITRFEPKERKY